MLQFHNLPLLHLAVPFITPMSVVLAGLFCSPVFRIPLRTGPLFECDAEFFFLVGGGDIGQYIAHFKVIFQLNKT